MKKGNIVLVDFVAKTDQGEIFDLTKEDLAKKEGIYNEKIKYEPIALILGEGTTMPGLEEGLLKMKEGEQKNITITPEKGFGNRDTKLIKIVPEKIFQGKIKPSPGLIVDFSGQKGRIQSSLGGRVRIDFNHPLAGKTLIYDIKIVKNITDDKEKIEAIFSLFNLKPDVNVAENKDKAEIKFPAQLHPMLKEKVTELIKKYTKVKTVSYVEPKADKNNEDKSKNLSNLSKDGKKK